MSVMCFQYFTFNKHEISQLLGRKVTSSHSSRKIEFTSVVINWCHVQQHAMVQQTTQRNFQLTRCWKSSISDIMNDTQCFSPLSLRGILWPISVTNNIAHMRFTYTHTHTRITHTPTNPYDLYHFVSAKRSCVPTMLVCVRTCKPCMLFSFSV